MKIYPIISVSGDSNTYILEDEETKAICIIDPGFSQKHFEKITSVIEKINGSLKFIINTHCHYDHITNCEHFKGVKIYMHKDDGKAVLEQNDEKITSYYFGMKVPKINNIEFVDENEIINLGKTKLKILHTPGHTSGSISVYEEKSKLLFSGDLIYVGGLGRTDLVSGSFEQLKDSINKVLRLGFKMLYPGHGRIGNYEDTKARFFNKMILFKSFLDLFENEEKKQNQKFKMATYIILGKYTVEGIKGASKERTKAVVDEIKKNNGKINAMYAMFGNYDFCFIVEFPTNNEAMRASVNITKATGIEFKTLPAMSVDEFDRML